MDPPTANVAEDLREVIISCPRHGHDSLHDVNGHIRAYAWHNHSPDVRRYLPGGLPAFGLLETESR